MKSVLLLAVALSLAGLAGCGAGGCDKPSGNYRIAFALRGGDCGAIAEQVGPVDFASPLTSIGCSGQRTLSADQCTVEATSMKCPAGGTSGRISGTLHFNADSSVGTGTLGLAIVDGSGVASCNGTYDVTYTKI